MNGEPSPDCPTANDIKIITTCQIARLPGDLFYGEIILIILFSCHVSFFALFYILEFTIIL